MSIFPAYLFLRTGFLQQDPKSYNVLQEDEAIEVMDGIVKAFEYFGRRAAVGFAIPEWLPTPENKEYGEAVRSLDTTVYRIIADRRKALADAAASTGEEPKPKV